MKVAIVVNGARGNVQPMLALEITQNLQGSNGQELTLTLIEKDLKNYS